MENKYLKYGLIAGAIFVWGAIIVRVMGGLSGPALPPPQAYHQQVAMVQASPESFILYADYPDPFLPEPDTLDEIDVKKTAPATFPGGPAPAVAPPAPPPPPTLKSLIQYIGLIANPDKKLKIAILSVNGKELLMREKEKKEGLLLKKIDRDKVIVEYKGRYGEIEKND